MKKLVSILVLLVLALSAVAVFAEETVPANDPVTLSVSEALLTCPWVAVTTGESVMFETFADKTYNILVDDHFEKGTWVFDGTNLILDKGTENEKTLTYNAKREWFVSSDGTLTLLRPEGSSFNAPKQVKAKKKSEFNGTWKLRMVEGFGCALTFDQLNDIRPEDCKEGFFSEEQYTVTIESGNISTAFQEEPFTGQLKKGALVAKLSVPSLYSESPIEGTANIQLLKDGSIKCEFAGLVLYYDRVE